MKKKLNIIVLLTLVVLTLFTFGCKKETELGADPSKWNNQESIAGVNKVLEIEAKDYDIDWWVLTKSNKVVYEDYTVTIDGVEVDPSAKIEQGKKAILTFNDINGSEKLNLYIAQEGRTPKKATEKKVDYTGWVYVSDGQGYRVKDSGYRDEVSQIGVVKLYCNETAKDSAISGTNINSEDEVKFKSGNWTGDYRITEIWPLTNKNGPQWEATEGLKFIFEGDDIVEEGEYIKVIYPAEESIFAIKQPNRFGTSDNAEKKAEQSDWYWCASFYEEFNGDLATESSSALGVKDYGPVKAHEVKVARSSECGAYFKLGNNTLYKSALGTTYIIDEADIVDGSSEK